MRQTICTSLETQAMSLKAIHALLQTTRSICQIAGSTTPIDEPRIIGDASSVQGIHANETSARLCRLTRTNSARLKYELDSVGLNDRVTHQLVAVARPYWKKATLTMRSHQEAMSRKVAALPDGALKQLFSGAASLETTESLLQVWFDDCIAQVKVIAIRTRTSWLPRSLALAATPSHATDLLELAFSLSSSPTTAEHHILARLTGLSEQAIRTWFQNNRYRRRDAPKPRLETLKSGGGQADGTAAERRSTRRSKQTKAPFRPEQRSDLIGEHAVQPSAAQLLQHWEDQALSASASPGSEDSCESSLSFTFTTFWSEGISEAGNSSTAASSLSPCRFDRQLERTFSSSDDGYSSDFSAWHGSDAASFNSSPSPPTTHLSLQGATLFDDLPSGSIDPALFPVRVDAS